MGIENHKTFKVFLLGFFPPELWREKGKVLCLHS